MNPMNTERGVGRKGAERGASGAWGRGPGLIRLLWKEIAAFWRFFRSTPATERAIVFYAEHEGYYAYFEGLVRELVGKHGMKMVGFGPGSWRALKKCAAYLSGNCRNTIALSR